MRWREGGAKKRDSERGGGPRMRRIERGEIAQNEQSPIRQGRRRP